eukprot:1192968-Prorocentrum_minimum.AAC.1
MVADTAENAARVMNACGENTVAVAVEDYYTSHPHKTSNLKTHKPTKNPQTKNEKGFVHRNYWPSSKKGVKNRNKYTWRWLIGLWLRPRVCCHAAAVRGVPEWAREVALGGALPQAGVPPVRGVLGALPRLQVRGRARRGH